jgi:TolB-like protein/DNA-binding winged helix-turn-helix (wHTH) protein/Flp pilus assembly protein TadD
MNIQAPDAHVFRFGIFELDTQSGELRRHGLKVRLPDQSFQILKTLIRRPGEVVTRDELRRVLWTAETFVDFEVGLNSAVRKLREALDDSAENSQFVQTLPRRGYRFVTPVNALVPPSTSPPEPALRAGAVPVALMWSEEETSAPVSKPVLTSVAGFRIPGWRAGGLLLVALVATAALYQREKLVDLRAGPAEVPIRSLVVLPFANLTGDAGQDYFVDAVTDAVTGHLAQVSGIDLISRTSARQYKGIARGVRQIGRELNVDGVVEGAVVRTESGVRITATLIRAATDRHLWAQAYEGQLNRMIPLQQRIASDVAVAAGRPPLPPAGGRTMQGIDAQAYDAYLKGITARGGSFRRAVAYFEHAIAIQPDFGEAYAELAMTQLQFLYGGPLSPRETVPKAEAAARKALQLDDTLPRAYLALGVILNLHYWRWEEGDKALRRGAELQGGGVDFSSAVVESLMRHGRFAEALAAAERGLKLDPLSLNAQIAAGNAHRAAGRHDRAIAELHRALEMLPGNNRAHFQLGVTFVAMGRMDEAIRELELAARPSDVHISRFEAYLGYAYAAAGRTHDARKVLKELESHRRDQYVSSFGFAMIHDALGEKELALAALQHAFDDRAVEFGQMAQYPPFKAIASEPRFQAVMRNVNLPR